MTQPQLMDTKTMKQLNDRISLNNIAVALTTSKVFKGADETASGVMKKGDIFAKTDDTFYVAVGVNPATNWVKLKP